MNGHRRVTANYLRSKAPLLRIDKLEFGDIVLSRSKGVESLLIAGVTGGAFSHAAIWLPSKSTRMAPVQMRFLTGMLWEADDFGIGFTPMETISLDRGDPSARLAVLPGSPCKAALVLRHEMIRVLDLQVLYDAADRLQHQWLHKPYSHFDRLPDATRLPPCIASAVARFLRLLDKNGNGRPTSGMFCSELIAEYYRQINLPLTGGRLSPERISPNQILNDSSLHQVPEAIVEQSAIDEDMTGEISLDLTKGPQFDRQKILEFGVYWRVRYDRAVALQSSIDNIVSNVKESKRE